LGIFNVISICYDFVPTLANFMALKNGKKKPVSCSPWIRKILNRWILIYSYYLLKVNYINWLGADEGQPGLGKGRIGGPRRENSAENSLAAVPSRPGRRRAAPALSKESRGGHGFAGRRGAKRPCLRNLVSASLSSKVLFSRRGEKSLWFLRKVSRIAEP
jgi:hypothetical protein